MEPAGDDGGGEPRQLLTVFLSFIYRIGSLGRPLCWICQDKIQEKRKLEGGGGKQGREGVGKRENTFWRFAESS